MTYSKLATASRKESPQSSSRQGVKIDMVIVHHCANTSAQGVVDMMTIPTKQVSSNYVMTKNGPIGVVREEMRAFTSGSSSDGGKGAAYDRRAITVETVNSTMGPRWEFDPRTIEHLARLIADVATRYGFPIDRDHVVGHGELYSRYRASYPTACPGPSMDLDALVRKARAYQQEQQKPEPQNTDTEDEDDMPTAKEVADEILKGFSSQDPASPGKQARDAIAAAAADYTLIHLVPDSGDGWGKQARDAIGKTAADYAVFALATAEPGSEAQMALDRIAAAAKSSAE